jgi:CheY-like chemotaxis protein
MNLPFSSSPITLSLVPGRYNRDYISGRGKFNQPRGKTFILSADDDPLTLITRRAILEMSGYEVLSAADGREALDIFAAHYVDLAILDYQMPRLDGAAVAREMKRLRPRLPILMVSGLLIEDDVKECVDSLFIKGQNPKLLLCEMERLLASSKFCTRAAAGF